MYTKLLLSILLATSLAAPLVSLTDTQASKHATWEPAAGTKTICDKKTDKIIGFYQGQQLESVLNDACAAMMLPCAYQERLAKDVMCTQTIDWPLQGPKKSTQNATVETREGKKITGWDVHFTVTPAAQPQDSIGVFWTKQDCYGYFANMLEKWEPEGCHYEKGSGVGSITVGGESSLKGTVFEVSFVAEQ